MTWYMTNRSGIWRRIGRQPENWLTPYDRYIAWVSSKIAWRLPLLRRWISLTSGASSWVVRIETVCLRNSGMSGIRMTIVSRMIAIPMSPGGRIRPISL